MTYSDFLRVSQTSHPDRMYLTSEVPGLTRTTSWLVVVHLYERVCVSVYFHKMQVCLNVAILDVLWDYYTPVWCLDKYPAPKTSATRTIFTSLLEGDQVWIAVSLLLSHSHPSGKNCHAGVGHPDTPDLLVQTCEVEIHNSMSVRTMGAVKNKEKSKERRLRGWPDCSDWRKH